MKYCNHYVWLSVCLFVHSHISKTIHTNFTKYACGRGSVFLWRQRDTLCTNSFVDEVMCLYNWRNAPESKKTHMFRPVRQLAAPVRRQTTRYSVEVAMWRYRGRSLPSPTSSHLVCICEAWTLTLSWSRTWNFDFLLGLGGQDFMTVAEVLVAGFICCC